MAEVNLPLVGPVNKKVLIISAAGAAGLLAVLYMRKRNAPATVTDTPVEDDLSDAMAGGGGSSGSGAGSGLMPVTSDTPTTNAEWTQLVMSSLSGIIEPGLLSQVLGKYLTGKPVTPDEDSVISQAIAVAGYPPIHGPNNYPPGVHLQVSTGQRRVPVPPPPSPRPPTPAPGPGPKRRYVITVRYGTSPAWRGTLSGIAGHTGRTVTQLQQWNNITNPNVIGIGKRIWVDPPGTYSGSIEVK